MKLLVHKKPIKKFSSLYLSLASVLVTVISPLQAANAPSSASIVATASQKLNLKLHEKRFSAYFEKMTAQGSVSKLSAEFLAVHQGMQDGQYLYDLETVRKVFQEVYASQHRAMLSQVSNSLHLIESQTE